MNPNVISTSIVYLCLVLLTALVGACADDDDTNAGAGAVEASSNGTNPEGLLPIGNCDPEEDGAEACTCISSESDRVAFSTCQGTPIPEGCSEVSESNLQSVSGCNSHSECVDDDGNQGYCNAHVGCGGGADMGCNCNARCVYDDCAVDSDCAGDELCLLRGSFGVARNTCIPFRCQTDADCTDEPGGECRLLGTGQVPAVVCAYPSDVCRSSTDCPASCGPYGRCYAAIESVGQEPNTAYVLSEPVTLQCFDDQWCLEIEAQSEVAPSAPATDL